VGETARRVARGAAVIAGLTVLARVVGFGRILVFARAVGSNCVAGTYQSANTVPNILFEIVAGGALASLVVPLLAGDVAGGHAERVRQVASALLTWVVLVLTPVAVLAAALAGPIMTALLGDSTCQGAARLGTRMLLVFAPQIVLYGVGIVLTGVLQAHERFAGPALAPLLSSLVVAAAYLAYRAQTGGADPGVTGLTRAQELTLSVGTTLGVVVLSLSLLVPLRRLGVRLTPTLRFPPGAARQARRLAGAGVAALAAQQVSVAVAVRLANQGVTGSTYVVYTFAMTVFLLPWAVLAVPLATSAYPRLAALADQRDGDGFGRTASGAVQGVVVVTLVAAAGLVAAAEPVARVLVEGVGARADVTALARGIVAFAPGLVGYGLVALLSRALYARRDTRTPALCQVAGWAAVVVADAVFTAALPAGDRVVALALGNSVGMTLAAGLLLAALARSAGAAAVGGLARAAGAAAVAALAAGAAGRVVAERWSGGGAGWAAVQAATVGVTVLAVAAAILLPAAGTDVRRAVQGRQEVTGG
jgi:putative peptidoglycan lipid II flippase